MGENYDAANEAVIRREEAAKNRREAKAEASAENFKNRIAALFKQENVKKAVAREASNATKHRDRINRLQEGAVEGTFRGYHSDEVINGLEPRPWEKD